LSYSKGAILAEQPALHTQRLTLRPFSLSDALVVQRLAGAKEIADTTLRIPHPYPNGAAQEWISTHARQFADGEAAIFAIAERESESLIGSIGLEISGENASAEMGYWIATPYWNQGYCTEAAGAILRFAFDTLGLNRVQARHLTRNPASGRVMQKIGMSHEGHLRQAVRKSGMFEDLEMYAILMQDFTR
jgi:ribosomal-protein-alanine N-acetyltransferase